MKTFIFALLFGLSLQLQANPDSLLIRNISLDSAEQLSKFSGKPILLYFHFKGCKACKIMETTVFTNPEVITFYNNSFITVSINTLGSTEEKSTTTRYGVKLQPAFLFLDKNLNPSHSLLGVFKPEDFLKEGECALKPGCNLTNLENQYNSGKRDKELLFQLTRSQDHANRLDHNIARQYLDHLTEQELKQEINIQFIYDYSAYQMKKTISVDSKAFKFFEHNLNLFYEKFDSSQVNVRLATIAYKGLVRAIDSNDRKLFDKMFKLLEPFKWTQFYYEEPDGRLSGKLNMYGSNPYLMEFYAKNLPAEFPKLESELTLKSWNSSNDLRDMSEWYSDFYDEMATEKLSHAEKLATRSIELEDNYESRIGLAKLCLKMKKMDLALANAEKAKELLKKDQKPTAINKLIEKIKAENPSVISN